MARPVRVEFERAAYHVTARVNQRRVIFRDNADWPRFVERIASLPEGEPDRCLRIWAHVALGGGLARELGDGGGILRVVRHLETAALKQHEPGRRIERSRRMRHAPRVN